MMISSSLYTSKQYLEKLINTFMPKFFFKLSIRKYSNMRYWERQGYGDNHGYDKYDVFHPRIPILLNELNNLVSQNESILDLGCNCGFYLSELKKAGFAKLSGVDISEEAIAYGQKHLNLSNVSMFIGSFENILPKLYHENRKFDLIYSMGATIEIVHPSFDIVKYLCGCSKKYIVLIISEWGHAYPRFWEYEFNRQGFLLIKCIRPYDNGNLDSDLRDLDSLLIFKRIKE